MFEDIKILQVYYKHFLRSIIDFYFLKNIFFTTYNEPLKFEEDKNMEENIIKDVRNLFRLKKEINVTAIKENKVIKDRILRDIRNIFEHEEEDYFKSVRVGNFWSNNYIE